MSDTLNNNYQDTMPDDVYQETYDGEGTTTYPAGVTRVIRLTVILLLVLTIVAILIFGVIPYVEAMSQSPVPLPPPVQA